MQSIDMPESLNQIWQGYIAELEINVNKGMTSFIDSTLWRMGQFIIAHKNELPGDVYERVINALNEGVKKTWNNAWLRELNDVHLEDSNEISESFGNSGKSSWSGALQKSES